MPAAGARVLTDSAKIQPKDGIMTRMNTSTRIIAALVLSGCAAPTFAQVYQSSYPTVRPVQWFIDAGGSITQNQTGDFFDNGWSVGTGVNFRPDPTQPFSLRAEVNYNRFNATPEFIYLNEQADQTPIDHGSMQTVTGFVDGVVEAPLNPWMHVYATGGVGVGYRRIELSQNGEFFCDVLCGPFGRNNLVASDDSTHFAWNAGLGLDFALPAGQSLFVEARYERIETQQPTEYIPIRFGIRF
jgi:opacity protein-like surface antigen